MSHSSMFCLSCPHSQVCRHLVSAGAVADRPVMVQEHSEKDQQDYLRLVQTSVSADGTRFKCRGLSAHPVHLPSLVDAMHPRTAPAPGLLHTPSDQQEKDPDADGGQLSSPCSPYLESDMSASSSDWGDGGVAEGSASRHSGMSMGPIEFSESRSSTALARRFQGQWHMEFTLDSSVAAERVHVCPKPRKLADADKEPNAEEYLERLVLHVGAAYVVLVPQYKKHPDGTPRPFDGADEGVLNMGRWLFTYEFLQAFLNQLFAGGATFRGYLRQALLNYDIACAGDTHTAGLHRQVRALREGFQCGDGRRAGTRGPAKALYKAFIDAVLDFITLQDIDYDQLLGCACVRSGAHSGPNVVVYDNACHTLDYFLAREPHLVKSFQFFVDKFHHRGHSACSPFMSHRSDPATAFMNSSVMEQGNRYPFLCRIRETFLRCTTS
jgi:hypothetical protein